MKWLLTLMVVVVLLLHHDIWFWKDNTLVLGFIPIGLAYHIFYSCLASLTMWILVRLAWPKPLEEDEKHA